MLEISESHLELLLDIISGSPLRIFKLKESESERDFKKFNFATDNEARLNTLCDITGYKRKELQKVRIQKLTLFFERIEEISILAIYSIFIKF